MMFRISCLLFSLLVAVLLISCDKASNTNSNTAAANSADQNANRLPPEFSTSPIPPSVNSTPGIPGNAVITSPTPGGTPIPGIDPKTAVKKIKPGATPTPGIPDQETIRRQMQGLERPNANATPGGSMMRPMKRNTPPANKP
jgi:hypothetical protein